MAAEIDIMIDLAEKEFNIAIRKKMLTRTIDHYREKQKETLVSACKLFGVNRRVYYRRNRSTSKRQETATKVVGMVLDIRKQMPRIGTRKLWDLLKIHSGN